jgi:hypothetical protein
MNHVRTAICADIEKHEKCTAETLLNALPSRCLLEEHKHNPPGDILNQCLKAVLPLCNNTQDPETTEQRQIEQETIDDCLALRKSLTK